MPAKPGVGEWVWGAPPRATGRSGRTPTRGAGNLSNSPVGLFTFLVVVDKRQLPLYHISMIRRFGHRGLRRLYENDDRRGVNLELVEKTARVLARLDVATRPEQVNLPGFRLQRLEGHPPGYWSGTGETQRRIIL